MPSTRRSTYRAVTFTGKGVYKQTQSCVVFFLLVLSCFFFELLVLMLVLSYNPDLDSDPFGEEGSLWSFNYFFYNKKLKRIVFFTCRSVRSAQRRSASLYYWHVIQLSTEELMFYWSLIVYESFTPAASWVDMAVIVSTMSWTWSWMMRRRWMDSLRTGQTPYHPELSPYLHLQTGLDVSSNANSCFLWVTHFDMLHYQNSHHYFFFFSVAGSPEFSVCKIPTWTCLGQRI